MSAKNNCNFIGNLGRDVELRTTQSGMAVASFSLPVVSGYGDNAKTSWVRCTMFGKRCEGGLMQYLVKGTSVSVTGEISLNTYTNKEGVEKSSLEMKIDDIALIGGKKEASNQPQSPASYKPQAADPFANQPSMTATPTDDIPF